MTARASAAEEPCNPIVDGTYCATNMPKKSGYVSSSSGMTGLADYSRLVPSAAVGGTPGTLIGIGSQGNRTRSVFSAGPRAIKLVRHGDGIAIFRCRYQRFGLVAEACLQFRRG
jgi:hypothetical protein